MKNPFFTRKDAAITAYASQQLFSKGVIPVTTHHALLRAIGARPDSRGWLNFFRAVLVLAGTITLACSITLFFVWYWQAIPRLVKFTFVEVTIVMLAILIWRHRQQPVARLALFIASLLLGGLIAIYGQTYQSGTETWVFCAIWAAALFFLAIFAHNMMQWFLCWLVANMAFFLLLLESDLSVGHSGIILTWLLSQLAMLVIWYRLRQRSDWLCRLMLFCLLISLTLATARWLYLQTDLIAALCALLWLGFLLLADRWPGGRESINRAGLYLSVGMVSVMVCIRLFLDFDLIIILAVALISAIVCVSLASYWLLPDKTETEKCAQAAVQKKLQPLRQSLSLSDAQWQAFRQWRPVDILPWYGALTFCLAGWLTGLLIFAFLLLTGMFFHQIAHLDSLSFLLLALLSAIPAWFMQFRTSFVIRQAGFAWAVACTVSLCMALRVWLEVRYPHNGAWLLAFLLPLGISVMLFRYSAWQRLNVAVMVCVLLTGLAYLPYCSALLPALAAALLTFVLIVSMTNDRCAARYHVWLEGILLGLVLICFYRAPSFDAPYILGILIPHPANLYGINDGIGVGLLLSALVAGRQQGVPVACLLLLLATLLATISLFAPGFALGWLLLLLARYQNSRTMLWSAVLLLVLFTLDWYYNLDHSLLDNALLLLMAGVVMWLFALLVHWRLQRRVFA